MLAGQTPDSYTVQVTFALYLPNCGTVGYSLLTAKACQSYAETGCLIQVSVSLAPAFHGGVGVVEEKLIPQI